MKNEICKILKVFITTYLFVGLAISCGRSAKPVSTFVVSSTPNRMVFPTNTAEPTNTRVPTVTPTPSIIPTSTVAPTFTASSTPTPTFTPTITPTLPTSWPPTQTRCNENGNKEPCLYHVREGDTWDDIYYRFYSDSTPTPPSPYGIPPSDTPPYAILYTYINRDAQGNYHALQNKPLLYIPNSNADPGILSILQFGLCDLNIRVTPCIYQVKEEDSNYRQIAQKMFGTGYAIYETCISDNNRKDINKPKSIRELKEGVLLVIPACAQIDR